MPELNTEHKQGLEWILIILILVQLSVFLGCQPSEVKWSGESKSPDGRLVATARYIDPSGLGAGIGGTFVFLNYTSGSQKPMLVLLYGDGPHGIEGMRVWLNWLSSNHLEIAYKGPRVLDFQAVRCYDTDISIRVLPGPK